MVTKDSSGIFRHRVHMARHVYGDTRKTHLSAYSGLARIHLRGSILLSREMQRRWTGFDGAHCPDSSTIVWILEMPPDLISDRSSRIAGSATARESNQSVTNRLSERASPRLRRYKRCHRIARSPNLMEFDGDFAR